MKYAARLGIIFVAALLASKVTPGFTADNEWYLISFCLIVGLINGLIRSVLQGSNLPLSWALIGVCAFALNIFLYWLTLIGAFSWLGISISTFGSALMSAAIVGIASALTNHFMGFKVE